MTHLCSTCGTAMQGRPDKRFCSPKCRSEAHRSKILSVKANDEVVRIDGILHRNYRILSVIMGEQKKVNFDKVVLERAGFNFEYHTKTYQNSAQKVYHYVYDFAWMTFSSEQVLVIRK